jgi:hypothetical protein
MTGSETTSRGSYEPERLLLFVYYFDYCVGL